MSRPRPLVGERPALTAVLLSLGLGLVLTLSACSDDSGVASDAASDAAVLESGVPDAGADALSRPDLPAVDALKPDALVQSKPQLQNVTLHVNLGDSIAAGYGVSKSYADLLFRNNDASYPSYQGKDLETLFPTIKQHDGAISGSTSAGMVQQLGGVPANPSGHTLVTVSAGGNDLLFTPQVVFDPVKVKGFAQNVAANLKKVVTHFADTTRYPGGATVVFYNLYDPSDAMGTFPEGIPLVSQCAQFRQALALVGPLLLKHLALYNRELATFAAGEPGIWLADMYSAFLGHGYHYNNTLSLFYNAVDPTLWFAYDCIHPNQNGHLGLRALLWQLLFAS
jgi:lysophospholipase L1-like esterase